MSKLNTAEIKEFAKRLIKESKGGIRYSEISKKIVEANPQTPTNTISGSIWNLQDQFPEEIIKPSRGLFVWKENSSTDFGTSITESKKHLERDFYEPFAEWLKRELEEATEAVDFGGSSLKNKWGTPDVIGIYKPLVTDIVKFPLEIISAEIKIDPYQPVVAFGQAVAYRLFSHKTYVVMPSSLSEEDKSRLDSLCMIYGVGFVIFDLNPANPNFEIRVRAQWHQPDMFYVNDLADKLRTSDKEKFQRLFG